MNQTFLWKENPFLRILFDLLLGILFAFGNDQIYVPFWMLITLIAACYVVILNLKTVLRYQFRLVISIIVHTALILLFYTHTTRYIDKHPIDHFSQKKEGRYVIEIQSQKGQSNEWNNYIGAVRFFKNWDNKLIQTSGKSLVHLKTKSKKPVIGDLIILHDSFFQIKPQQQPTTFDYTQYIANQQIYYEFYLDENEWFHSKISANNLIEKLAFSVKDWVIEYLNLHFKNKTHKGILQALLIGDRSELSSEIRQSFSETGTIHVLAISGLHLGIIYLMLTTLFKPFSKRKLGNLLSTIVIICVLWMFALITGFSPSVSRSATMFSLFAIGELLNRRKSPINSWAATCCILLIVNPLNVTQVGFQFSFLAVLGILVGYKPIRRYIISSNWLLSKIIELLIVSFCAQLAILPLSVYYFHQFPVYFLLSNLLIVPCITLVMYASVIGMLLSAIPLLSSVFNYATNAYLWTSINLNSLFEKLPNALISDWHITQLQAFILYIGILAVGLFCQFPKRKWFYTFLSAFSLYLLLSGLNRLEHHEQQILISYKIKRQNIPMLIQANKCIVFSAPDSNSVQTNKNISSWLKQQFVTEIQNLSINKPFWLEAGGQRILFTETKQEAITIARKINPNVVIVAGSIYRLNTNTLLENELSIPYYGSIDKIEEIPSARYPHLKAEKRVLFK